MFSILSERRPIQGTRWENEPNIGVLVTWDTLEEAEACLAMIEWHRANRHLPGIWRFTGTRYWIARTGNAHRSSSSTYTAGKPEYAAVVRDFRNHFNV